MKYLIGSLSLLVFLILGSATIYCGYLAATKSITWGFVMLGMVLPTAVSLLITQVAFNSAREY